MPLIKDLLDSVQIHKSKLNYIAASIGPGSFTGIRIGVATARALAQVLDIPAVAVPTLDAFCCKPQARGGDYVACGIINARRGQVYGIIDGFMQGQACMLTDVIDVIKKRSSPEDLRLNFSETG